MWSQVWVPPVCLLLTLGRKSLPVGLSFLPLGTATQGYECHTAARRFSEITEFSFGIADRATGFRPAFWRLCPGKVKEELLVLPYLPSVTFGENRVLYRLGVAREQPARAVVCPGVCVCVGRVVGLDPERF